MVMKRPTTPTSAGDLLAHRGLDVSVEDDIPLTAHWEKMRQLRSSVDEGLLADQEIAVTWTPSRDGSR